jgi:uncharacterized protein
MTAETIQDRLNGLLEKEQAQCLFAVESGSRAWGFQSENSDYDVRFVYWKPVDRYLTTVSERDVIEEIGDDDLDFAGWDIRKALQLASKSNPSLHDWLVTHIIYQKSDAWFPEFHQLCLDYFCPQACFKHYVSMARTNYANFSDRQVIPYKKYFYVVRSLLCAKHIQTHQTPAPCAFGDLVEAFVSNPEVKSEIARLLAEKKLNAEKAVGPRNMMMWRMIHDLFNEVNQAPAKREKQNHDSLDDFFRRIVRS